MNLPYDHRSVANTDTRFAPNKQGRACVFFRMAPSGDGERARQLANTLLGAKDGGHHHSEAHIGVDELASSDTMLLRLSYDNNMVLRVNRPSTRETVAQAQRRLVRRKLVNTTARS